MNFSPVPSPAEPSPREEIGLQPFPPLSEEPCPTVVDRDQIRDLLEGRLSPQSDEFQRIHGLIHGYRDWHDAERDVIMEQYETWRALKDRIEHPAE